VAPASVDRLIFVTGFCDAKSHREEVERVRHTANALRRRARSVGRGLCFPIAAARRVGPERPIKTVS